MKIRHRGFGKFDVVNEDGSVAKEGPLNKVAAQKFIRDAQASPEERQASGDRQYQARMAKDLRAPFNRKIKLIRELLVREGCDDDEVRAIMKVVEPAVRAGKQAVRRERKITTPPRTTVDHMAA